MNETIPYLGQVLSLLAAVTWASAVILFKKSGETVHPIALNLFKNLLALILFLPTLWISGGTLMRQVPAWEYFLFMLSGVLGIGIGDTLFLKSLNRIGAGLSAIVICLYSPFIIGLSYLWLGEKLAALQAVGALMIIAAVLLTTRVKDTRRIGRTDLLWGILWGVLATAAMAVGIVMIKPWLVRAPLFWAIETRLLGGIMSLAVIVLFHPSRQKILASLLIPAGRIYTVSGSFMGAYLAMLVWLAGMKLTQVSIASALNQTSTFFVFLFAALFLREPITLRRTMTIILAACGAFLVTFG